MAEEPMSQAKHVRAIYSIMNGIENNIGGGEGVEGLYGSITGTHMQRMFAVMKEHCGFDTSSHLVDIGAGLGRPLLHALATEGISGATGIELDSIKCMKAEAFLKQTVKAMLKKGLTTQAVKLPEIECNPVEKVRSLDPATHAYSFWEGVPVDARVAFGRLFAGSKTLRSVTVVQRSMRAEDPEEVMEHGYGFGPVNLVETLSVSMSGSNRHFTAYIFNKSEPAAVLPRRRGARAAALGAAAVAPAVEEVDNRFEKAVTPPLSGDNAKLCSKNSDSAFDGVSKKLDLTDVEVASPAVGARGSGNDNEGSGLRNKSRPGRPSKINSNQIEIETEAPVMVRRQRASLSSSSPIEQATPAPSKRSSPRKLSNQRPILAALTTRRRLPITKQPQQPQKNVVIYGKKQRGITTAAENGGKESPNKSMSREARGLLGGGGGGGNSRGVVGAAELLEGSSYPRTRHAVSLLS